MTNDALRFTQYLRPDGRKQDAYITVPQDVYAKAMKINEAGFDLTIEQLSTGDISMCVEGRNMDLAQRVCGNGPQVPVNVREMIMEFDINDGINRDKHGD